MLAVLLSKSISFHDIRTPMLHAYANNLNVEQCWMILQESRVRNSHMIVGFSPFVTSVKELVILGERIKENYPNIFIIVGGHFAAFHKDYLLKEYVWLDAVIVGEGKLSLYEYCLSPTEKVAGVLKRNTGFKPRPRMRKRGRAKLERVLSRANGELSNILDLLELYIFTKQAEGTSKGALTNKRLAVNKFIDFVKVTDIINVSLRVLNV